jgi:AsmA protein
MGAAACRWGATDPDGSATRALLDQFAGYDRLEGTGSASLQFLGVGNDMATIMSGLQGQGDFAFGAGRSSASTWRG